MDIANKLRHPGWLGVVLPLLLAVAATFSPSAVRAVLLVCAVLAATWTFHNTEFAGRNRFKTACAALAFSVAAIMLFIVGRSFDNTVTSPSNAEARKRLFTELAMEKNARLKAYRDDYVANLNYNAMDYQLRSPHMSPGNRVAAETKRTEFLTSLSKTYEAVEAEEQKFSGMLAEIKLSFPDSPLFREHIAAAEERPTYSVKEPTNPPYPEDAAQHFLDTEGEKVSAALKSGIETPIDNLLSDMQIVIAAAR